MADWFDLDWDYSEKVTVDYTKIPATLSDFPVYVDLSSMSSNFFSNVKSDGGDIRVTQSNGTTQQAVEIVFITTGSSIGELHFKASSLSSTVDTDFYIYYGNSAASKEAASSTYGSQNVWDSDHLVVYHCQEDPSGGANAVKDSTSNAIHATGAGSMTSGDLIDGKLAGKGYDFNGASGDWIDTADDITVNADYTNGGTLSAWLNSTTTVLSQPISVEGFFNISSRSSKYEAGAGGLECVEVSAPGAGYHFVTIEFDSYSGTAKLYVDNESTVSATALAANVDSTTRPFRLGAHPGGSFRFVGEGDEVRLTINRDRGRDWHDATFSNQGTPGTFYTVAAYESAPVSFTPQLMWWT